MVSKTDLKTLRDKLIALANTVSEQAEDIRRFNRDLYAVQQQEASIRGKRPCKHDKEVMNALSDISDVEQAATAFCGSIVDPVGRLTLLMSQLVDEIE